MTDLAASPTMNKPTGRQIRLWGSVARAIVGIGLLATAAIIGVDLVDVLLGLVVFPVVEIALLAVRGRNASQVRLYGNVGHCINWGVGILLFSISTEAALLFYGASVLLAFVRGYAGCEIMAISNWIRRRDDQIVCPLFSPIDQAEARRAGADRAC